MKLLTALYIIIDIPIGIAAIGINLAHMLFNITPIFGDGMILPSVSSQV